MLVVSHVCNKTTGYRVSRLIGGMVSLSVAASEVLPRKTEWSQTYSKYTQGKSREKRKEDGVLGDSTGKPAYHRWQHNDALRDLVVADKPQVR